MEEVSLEQALELLQYPKKLGKFNRKEIQLCKGQYGFYLKYDKKNYSVEKPVESNETNLHKSIAIFKVAADSNTRVVFSSSSAIFL